MDDVDDIVDRFQKQTDDEKLVSFEQSTVAQLLLDYGYDRSRVKGAQRSMGPGFSIDWLNATTYFPVPVATTRVFVFNFEELFTTKRVHPIVQADLEAAEANPADFWLILKSHGIGRLILTTGRLLGVRAVVPTPQGDLQIAPYRGMVKRCFGQTDEPSTYLT